MFCPQCGKENTPDANFCPACGTALVRRVGTSPADPIVRPRYPRMIAGVCSGVALHYGWQVSLVRILLVVFTLMTGGLGVIVYLAAWVLLPDGPFTLPQPLAGQTVQRAEERAV